MKGVKRQDFLVPTELQRLEVIDLILQGVPDHEIAAEYNFSMNTVRGLRVGNASVKNFKKEQQKAKQEHLRRKALSMIGMGVHSSIIMDQLKLSSPQLSELTSFHRSAHSIRRGAVTGTHESRLRMFKTSNEHQTGRCAYLIEEGELHRYCNSKIAKKSYCQEHLDLCYIASPYRSLNYDCKY